MSREGLTDEEILTINEAVGIIDGWGDGELATEIRQFVHRWDYRDQDGDSEYEAS